MLLVDQDSELSCHLVGSVVVVAVEAILSKQEGHFLKLASYYGLKSQ